MWHPADELLVLEPVDDVGHRGRRDAQGLADPAEGQEDSGSVASQARTS